MSILDLGGSGSQKEVERIILEGKYWIPNMGVGEVWMNQGIIQIQYGGGI